MLADAERLPSYNLRIKAAFLKLCSRCASMFMCLLIAMGVEGLL